MTVLLPVEIMKIALEEARTAAAENEVPIGAVLDLGDGSLIRGHNRAEAEGPLAHAELIVLERALKEKGREAVGRATLFVTVEPCIMCLGAMVHARIGGLVYGAPEPKFGGIGILEQARKEGRYPYSFPVHAGLMEEEAALLMKEFFGRLR
ncbi:MAG TPA: nucleoside deaminase [Acidobacteriota bacterium]|jgi:tRNA(adenine34) deaminase|nr:nucleoside deaminase [Acidobacteriota bacterium]HNT18359.1 nucleoside deaminase [Acidobacteriota bacterium]HPA26756.1 nucleoside deaminase [Acidobacteriota bacterium]HQO20463.1 nucleoside deaminase [Acidobacteriota bacterium]HQQ47090.1 nucleoside deaminase [Acidobacteriota bacterium]